MGFLVTVVLFKEYFQCLSRRLGPWGWMGLRAQVCPKLPRSTRSLKKHFQWLLRRLGTWGRMGPRAYACPNCPRLTWSVKQTDTSRDVDKSTGTERLCKVASLDSIALVAFPVMYIVCLLVCFCFQKKKKIRNKKTKPSCNSTLKNTKGGKKKQRQRW